MFMQNHTFIIDDLACAWAPILSVYDRSLKNVKLKFKLLQIQ